MTNREIEARLQAIVHNRIIALGYRRNRMEKTVLRSIWPSLVQLERKIRAEFYALSGDPWTKKRYAELSRYVKDALVDTYDIVGIEAAIREELMALATDEYIGAGMAVSFNGIATNIEFAGLSMGQAAEMVKFPAAGSPLNKWITNLGAGTVNRLQNQITQGWMLGESSRELAKRFKSVMRGSEAEAITMSRTWTHDVANRANARLYEENKDVLIGVEWSAVLDNRTCPRCGPLDGQRWYFEPGDTQRGMDEIPAGVSGQRPPRHPRCRCELLPLTKSWAALAGVEDEADLKKIEDRFRPYTVREGQVGRGGAKIKEVGQHRGDFESWIKQHPDLLRDQVGATRFKMLQDGKLKYKDLIDERGNFLTLKELRGE